MNNWNENKLYYIEWKAFPDLQCDRLPLERKIPNVDNYRSWNLSENPPLENYIVLSIIFFIIKIVFLNPLAFLVVAHMAAAFAPSD